LTKRQVERLLDDVERAGDDPSLVRAALATAGVPPAQLDRPIEDLFDLVATLNETRVVPADADLEARARAWIADDPDPDTRAELEQLLAAGDLAGVADRFRGRLGFGTAGIRGELGAGPNRMNRAVARATAAGVAAWVTDRGHGIVIGRDGRRKSDVMADDIARVVSGAGIDAHVLPGVVPTPVLAFAVRHLGTGAGIMVTASHNPPNDNGIKVYSADGAQIVPPADGDISAAIEAVPSIRAIPTSDDRVHAVGESLIEAYLDRAAEVVGPGPRDVRVVHTAMHGVGWDLARRLFARAGFPAPIPVAEQATPDGRFPTVSFPNPEEPGALDLAFALATAEHADVVLANDPDADRLGVAIPVDGGWRQLTGDEAGILLADHILTSSTGEDRLVACSLVSSSMLTRMAAAHGVHVRTTLTGFKWIARAADDVPGSRFVFGYEEALGYAVSDLVRDKDGLTAALLFADLVARLKDAGRTVEDRLEDLARTFGLHATRQYSLRRPVAAIRAAVASISASPPAAIAGRAVQSTERPAPDILVLHLEGGARVIIRPSGTEPKLKTYLQVVIDDIGDWAAAKAAAAADIESLRRGVIDALGLGD
jgi:phosphomannomutase